MHDYHIIDIIIFAMKLSSLQHAATHELA